MYKIFQYLYDLCILINRNTPQHYFVNCQYCYYLRNVRRLKLRLYWKFKNIKYRVGTKKVRAVSTRT